MIAVMRPFGEVVRSPFEVRHTDSELSELVGLLKSLDGETLVVMEATGNYHAPVARFINDAGIYVSVVNAIRSTSRFRRLLEGWRIAGLLLEITGQGEK